MAASVNNYHIGKGIVSFKATGGAYVDLGNVSNFRLSAANEELKHYSSRTGIKTLDRTISLSVEGTVKFTMEEVTLENLAIALLGSDPSVSGGDNFIDILAETELTGSLKCVGTNDVGRKFTVELFSVTIKPGAEISFIGEEWNAMEVEATVQSVNGRFGTITELTASTEV